jgi:hypothetical protein
VNKLPGKILKAPEYFLTQKDIQAVKTQAQQGRRDFLAQALAARPRPVRLRKQPPKGTPTS